MTDNSPTVSSIALRDVLRQVPLFVTLSDRQFECIIQGTEVWLQPGEYLVREGDPPEGFFIQLTGQTEWTRKVGLQEVYLFTHGAGEFYGHEILIPDKPCPVSGRAMTDVHLYKLEPDAFWQMLSTCPTILRSPIATLGEREGTLGTVEQQHTKLVSLGTMAAGLAHELNNPAAAARRAVDVLRESFEAMQSLTFKLLAGGVLSSQCLAEIDREVQECAKTAPTLNILEQSDCEEEIFTWLEAHGIARGWQITPTLIGAGLDVAWLETLAARSHNSELQNLLSWIEASLTTRDLLSQVKSSTERISTLVKAVKEYSFMDQAPLQEVDVHEGLENTLVILGHNWAWASASALSSDTIMAICASNQSQERRASRFVCQSLELTQVRLGVLNARSKVR